MGTKPDTLANLAVLSYGVTPKLFRDNLWSASGNFSNNEFNISIKKDSIRSKLVLYGIVLIENAESGFAGFSNIAVNLLKNVNGTWETVKNLDNNFVSGIANNSQSSLTNSINIVGQASTEGVWHIINDKCAIEEFRVFDKFKPNDVFSIEYKLNEAYIMAYERKSICFEASFDWNILQDRGIEYGEKIRAEIICTFYNCSNKSDGFYCPALNINGAGVDSANVKSIPCRFDIDIPQEECSIHNKVNVDCILIGTTGDIPIITVDYKDYDTSFSQEISKSTEIIGSFNIPGIKYAKVLIRTEEDNTLSLKMTEYPEYKTCYYYPNIDKSYNFSSEYTNRTYTLDGEDWYNSTILEEPNLYGGFVNTSGNAMVNIQYANGYIRFTEPMFLRQFLSPRRQFDQVPLSSTLINPLFTSCDVFLIPLVALYLNIFQTNIIRARFANSYNINMNTSNNYDQSIGNYTLIDRNETIDEIFKPYLGLKVSTILNILISKLWCENLSLRDIKNKTFYQDLAKIPTAFNDAFKNGTVSEFAKNYLSLNP